MKLGDVVYYKGSNDLKPLGTLIGVRETSWPDQAQPDLQYTVMRTNGRMRTIFGDIITNIKPE
tara:strand:+ start:203 stop:391 length:189 start_codon:yes stop_codon:yes gene_type:complete